MIGQPADRDRFAILSTIYAGALQKHTYKSGILDKLNRAAAELEG